MAEYTLGFLVTPEENTSADSTYTLVIYEQVPESNTLYLVPNEAIGPEEEKLFSLVHGRVVNGDDLTEEEMKATLTLGDVLCAEPKYLSGDNPVGSRFGGTWAKYRVEDGKVPLTGVVITRVVKSVFLL